MKKNNWLLILFILLYTSSIYGEGIIIENKKKREYIINPVVYLLKTPKGINSISEVATAPADSFLQNPYLQEVNYGFNQPFGWCKFTITNQLDSMDWMLKVHQGRIDSLQLYVQKQNGTLIRYPLTGHFQNIMSRQVYSLHFAHVLSIPKGETITCYLYSQRKFGRHAALLSLHNVNDYKHYDHLFFIFISIIFGIIILACLVGIVLCIFVFDKVYIYYSVYCLSFIFLMLCDSGFIHSFYTDPKYQDLLNNFNMIFYYWIVGWHFLFTIELLSIKTHPQKWVYWVGYGSGFLFCFIAVVMLLPIPDSLRWWLSLISYYVVFYVDAYILYVIIIKLFKNDAIVYFYMAGFLFTLLVASILMLADLQIMEGINHTTDLFFITPVVEILCMVIGLGIHFSNHVKEKLRTQIQLNETQHRIITVQEEEQKRIAQDLHDQIGNSLAAVKNMLIQKRENVLIDKEIDKILEDVRNISHNLMPVDFQEFKLPDIIRQTLNKFTNYSSVRFDFELAGTPIKIDPFKELIIYRIVNELISNILKHSEATTAFVQLIYQEETLVLMVEDNGKGIDKNKANLKNGLGLKSIQLRAEYIGAKLSVESDHKGTLIIVELPYEQKQQN